MAREIAPVWIVDDDADDQKFMAAAFSSLHPSVPTLVLDDGEMLLTQLQRTDALPKLIVLDLNMPRVSGFDALRQLRQVHTSLPVVVLTTSDEPIDRQRALALGANQFFTKPLTYRGLQALAQQLAVRWYEAGSINQAFS